MAPLLTTVGLEQKWKDKLNSAGYSSTEELVQVMPIHLAYELSVTIDEAAVILQQVQSIPAVTSGPQSLRQLLETSHNQTSRVITTSSPAVDAMLRGGIPIGKMTEFIGPPGLGKTQFGMQICLNATLSTGGEAIYVDTEGSFFVDRVLEMAQYQNCDADEVLSRFHYFRIHDYTELMNWLHALDAFLAQHSRVSVIVIDSIASPFRQNVSNMAQRMQLLTTFSQKLMQLASTKYRFAIVVMNQITTKFGKSVQPHHIHTEGDGILVPSLGDSWGHAATNRIMLYWKEGLRVAHLFKSSYLKEKTVNYAVEARGICDINPSQLEEASRKRMKPEE